MPIPFPKLHIAESALNRVLNALEENQTGLGLPMPTPDMIPNTQRQSLELDDKLSQAPGPAEVPPGTEETSNNAMLESSLTGGSPFDGALMGALE